MNLESVTGAIRHIWGFLVPPLLNLLILVSLGVAMLDLSCGANVPSVRPLSSAAQPAPATSVAASRPPEAAASEGPAKEQATPDPRAEFAKLVSRAIDKLTLKDLPGVELPKLVDEASKVLGQVLSFMGSMAAFGFTALLYAIILIIAVMLMLDLITRSISAVFHYILDAVDGYGRLKRSYLKLFTYLSNNSPSLETISNKCLAFEAEAIPNSPSTDYLRARLATQGYSKMLSNYELYEISLAWLSRNAASSQWKTDRDVHLQKLAVLEQIIQYVRAYVFVSVLLFALLVKISCEWKLPLVRVIEWEVFLFVAWLVLTLSMVVSRRRLMCSDIDAYRFYQIATGTETKASTPV